MALKTIWLIDVNEIKRVFFIVVVVQSKNEEVCSSTSFHSWRIFCHSFCGFSVSCIIVRRIFSNVVNKFCFCDLGQGNWNVGNECSPVQLLQLISSPIKSKITTVQANRLQQQSWIEKLKWQNDYQTINMHWMIVSLSWFGQMHTIGLKLQEEITNNFTIEKKLLEHNCSKTISWFVTKKTCSCLVHLFHSVPVLKKK